MRLLCGDIGGTKTLLQLIQANGTNHEVVLERRYPSADFASFDLILADFLAAAVRSDIAAACFGVAGPVMEFDDYQSARITNLPWQMDTRDIAKTFALPRVHLINDFQAVGYGIEVLSDDDMCTLQQGQPIAHGNQLVIGAGTGLGVALRIWTGEAYKVVPTEGGHADFAPADELQLQLAAYLIRRFGRSSVEYVLSGPGLVNVYSFVCEQAQRLGGTEVDAVMQAPDPAAAIAAQADREPASLAGQAMRLFVQAYGSQAGNFALSGMALGGVYVAGGIAAKILHYLQNGDFIDNFMAKGKMAELMQKIPLRVVTNANVGLIGSRVYAEKLASL